MGQMDSKEFLNSIMSFVSITSSNIIKSSLLLLDQGKMLYLSR